MQAAYCDPTFCARALKAIRVLRITTPIAALDRCICRVALRRIVIGTGFQSAALGGTRQVMGLALLLIPRTSPDNPIGRH
jgi:hypothetical protein